jgi:hemoglobin
VTGRGRGDDPVEGLMASMFERYGGFARVSKIVMAFYDKVLDSDVIGEYFEDVDMRALMDHQTKFIAQVMGGPTSYTNEALQRIHAHLGIDRPAFDEATMLLRETLEEFELAPQDVDAIMEDMISRARYIVTA